MTLPISPYTLGVWLSRGLADTGAVLLSRDHEPFVNRMRERGVLLGLRHSCNARTGTYRYTLVGVQSHLRTLGLIGCKHLPSSYLAEGEPVWRDLAAGLLESRTQGEITRNVYETPHKLVAEGLSQLLAHFGFTQLPLEQFAIRRRGFLRKPWYRLALTPPLGYPLWP